MLDYFLPFYPVNQPKNQHLKKWKNTPGDIIILQMCTKNYDQMTYGSWDIVHNRWMDGNGWMDGHVEVGAPPKNNISRTKTHIAKL